MAPSPLRSKFLHHNRSLSFPSKINPTSSQLDEKLSDVKGFEAASCSSLSSMRNSVNGLKNLYSGIDELLLLPHIQQIISQESKQKWVDQVLEGYIRLLDACSTAKDLISNTKHDVQELLSALRRKDTDGIRCYLNSRRRSKKNIQKSLRSFTSKPILVTLEKDRETSDLVCKLNEAESITVGRLESLLSYLIGARIQAKQSGWSLVAKLMHTKKGGDACWNEFEKMDAFLQMSLDGVQVDELLNLSKEVDSSIQSLEEEIECLFRQLIKTRVFLLNILNH